MGRAIRSLPAALAVCATAILGAGAIAALMAQRPPSPPPAAAAADREPGGAAEDVALAVSDPDEYAWRLFFFINRQARPGAAGLADPARSIRVYEPDQPVVWETWALVSGAGASQEGSEVYRPDGGDPGAWTALARTSWPAKRFGRQFPGEAGPPSMEIRINRAGYEFVRGHGLYNQEGLQRVFAEAVARARPDLIQFPTGAKEVKARWRDLGPAAAPARLARYHWRQIDGHYWVLTGFHITTKDLPNWFWADFEQVDEPVPPGEPSRDSTTREASGAPGPAMGAVEGERRELAGTKWAYYRLRGTQTSFTDARGVPTRLSNGVIEANFEHTSCMTCHARATIGMVDGKLAHLQRNPAHFDDAEGRPPAIADLQNPDLGAPSPSLFGSQKLAFLQTDFVWSIPLRAQPRAR